MNMLTSPVHVRWLEAEGDRLLDFARGSRHPAGGFAWLDADGRPELGRPVELWLTARMTHVFALAHLMGRPGARALVDHGVAALTGRFHDAAHAGWYAAVDDEGPTTTDKTAYEHAFVVLAAASATAADRPGCHALLEEALLVQDEHFWDEEHGMVVEQWDQGFTVLDAYRGVNANMHTVEALLAAADVLGDDSLRQKALRITTRVVHDLARHNQWRIPEHFDSAWNPLLDYNHDQPAHPFRPYGATVGHSLEWSRLALHLAAALGTSAPTWLLDDSRSLFATAVADGWVADGAPGFLYTVDWDGTPVVHERMHWVVAEATAAAAALHSATGEAEYARWYATWWGYIAEYVVDRDAGSWHHELSMDNCPSSIVWRGKPDVYHAFQATLIPRLPLAPALAVALRDGLLS
jgi:mannose/cellobiose epimerase-like protein (N-acyl-D-glucosamine 2-epimerase family)